MLDVVTPLLPEDKPRYLMGVGTPEDLINGVARGVDIFDCVLPTRLARHHSAFAPEGRLNMMNADFARDPIPLTRPATATPAKLSRAPTSVILSWQRNCWQGRCCPFTIYVR